jgi:hypothetical protein
MKKLKDFLAEEVDATEYVERGSKDFNNDAVRDNINMILSKAVSVCSITPYIAFEKVSKVLAVFHIHLPKTTFLEGDHGFKTFTLSQFGTVMGMRNDGEVVTKIDSPYTLYFEWKQNEKGMFDVFAEIVNDGELKDILDDVEDDISTEEPIDIRKDKMGEKTDNSDLREENKATKLLKKIGDDLVAKTIKSEKERKKLIAKNKASDPERYEDKTKGMKSTNWRGLREESLIKGILSKVKKKLKEPLDTRSEKELNDRFADDPRNLKESKKKIAKPKTNAPVLRDALAKAKTEIAQLKAAYKTPNQTKQPAKSMALSHPAPEPHETETVPLSKEKEEHIHKFGYLEEAAKKRALGLVAKQQRDYARRKGELPPNVQGKSGYNVTQKQKKSLAQILSKQERNRKEAMQAKKGFKKPESPQTPEHPSVPMVSQKAYDFDSHLQAYHNTGNKAHLDAAEHHAKMELAKEKLRLSRSGVSGPQGHVDREYARRLHNARLSTVRDLRGEPKKGIMSRIKAFFKEETLLKEEYSK